MHCNRKSLYLHPFSSNIFWPDQISLPPSTVNILPKIAHFFHSSKFWVSLIFPGFSRCFLATRVGHERYLCQKSYEKERKGAQRQNFCVFILQIGVNFLRTVRKVLKTNILIDRTKVIL